MASVSVSGNRELFGRLRKTRAVEVEVANGNIVLAKQRGDVQLTFVTTTGKIVRTTIRDVLFHEDFGINLLSWNMLREQGWRLLSCKKESFIESPDGDRTTLNTAGRLLVLESAPLEHAHSLVVPPAAVSKEKVQAWVNLHETLAHMGFDRMEQLARSGEVLELANLSFDPAVVKEARTCIMECRSCFQGKGTRVKFGHRGLDRGSPKEPFGTVLHCDTMHVSAEDELGTARASYGLVLKEPRLEWLGFSHIDTKDECAQEFIKGLCYLETLTGTRAKRVHVDGGGEFINRSVEDFCSMRGTELPPSPPRTPELNGIAERTVRTVKDGFRTLMMRCGLPSRYWPYAARHFIYVWNRTHIAAETKKTPYHELRGKKASVRHLAPFGCDAWVHVPKQHRGASVSAKMEPAVYLGHDHAHNCANVWVLRTKKVIVTRDVRYIRGSFQFAAALRTGYGTPQMEAALRGDQAPGLEWHSSQSIGGMPDAEIAIGTIDEDGGAPSEEKPDDDAAVTEDEREYKVERILDCRTRGRGLNKHLEYLVRWEGYDGSHDTWEPEGLVRDLAALDDFLRDNPPAGPRRSARARGLPATTEASENPRPEPQEQASTAAESSQQQGRDEEEPTKPLSEDRNPSDSEPNQSGADPTAALEVDEESIPSDALVREQARMAVVALGELQLDEERPSRHEMVYAVSAGLAQLEARTPKTYRQAITCPEKAEWYSAMGREKQAVKEQAVWVLVRRRDLPRGAKPIPVKWVYKIKVDEHGRIASYKARITPKGFHQMEGRDFFETFARTGMYKSLRAVLSLVASWNYELVQLDVPTAFLNAPVEEDVYMELPEGYEEDGVDPKEWVCKLNKSLYGLKQAPRNWDLMVHAFITKDMAWRATVSDPSLYFKRSRTGRLMMIFRFVDDMQGSFHAEDSEEFHASMALLQRRFNIKSLGPAEWMLGMRITRDRAKRTITLDQEVYVTKALERFGMEECRVAPTPEVVGADNVAHPQLDEPVDRQLYMEKAGTIMYAAISTRLDIMHAVHYLASHMQAPTRRHMLAADRVLRYLAGTKDVGLVFGARNGDAVGDSRGRTSPVQVDVCAFADADWAGDRGDRKSVSGWVSKLNGDPISWSSKKQRVVALSTAEAELYAEAAAIQEVLWLRGLLKEMGLHPISGSVVHGDNRAAIALSKNGVKSERTKHVDVKYHFITETVEGGQVRLQWVESAQQQADIFTKALGAPVFLHFRKELMTR
jgi:hypothetical protein